jgi:hypothetical protein
MALVPSDWQLIKFDPSETLASLGIPSSICGFMPAATFLQGALFLAKVQNPQRFYWLNSMGQLPAGVSSNISSGHKASEFPQGFGGTSCDAKTNPWPPVDPAHVPLPANYTLSTGMAVGGTDIAGTFTGFR